VTELGQDADKQAEKRARGKRGRTRSEDQSEARRQEYLPQHSDRNAEPRGRRPDSGELCETVGRVDRAGAGQVHDAEQIANLIQTQASADAGQIHARFAVDLCSDHDKRRQHPNLDLGHPVTRCHLCEDPLSRADWITSRAQRLPELDQELRAQHLVRWIKIAQAHVRILEPGAVPDHHELRGVSAPSARLPQRF
jgi:hypothetical protein